jgi:hypothetical protein
LRTKVIRHSRSGLGLAGLRAMGRRYARRRRRDKGWLATAVGAHRSRLNPAIPAADDHDWRTRTHISLSSTRQPAH